MTLTGSHHGQARISKTCNGQTLLPLAMSLTANLLELSSSLRKATMTFMSALSARTLFGGTDAISKSCLIMLSSTADAHAYQHWPRNQIPSPANFLRVLVFKKKAFFVNTTNQKTALFMEYFNQSANGYRS